MVSLNDELKYLTPGLPPVCIHSNGHTCAPLSTQFGGLCWWFFKFCFRGAVEATREAHHLILTLIKDPECDINDHLPRSKQPQNTPASHRSSFEFPAASTHSTAHDASRVSRVPSTSVSLSTTSHPLAIPSSRNLYSRPEKRSVRSVDLVHWNLVHT